MIIAQLSDPHIAELDDKFQELYDTAGKLALSIEKLNSLRPRPVCAVMSGDLVNSGLSSEYKVFKDIIAKSEVPLYLGIGNHDHREVFLEEFKDQDYLPKEGFVQYAVDLGGVRLIMLDTYIPKSPNGTLCEERLKWLDDTLSEDTTTPALIFMHHPPFKTGIEAMDIMGLKTPEPFEKIVEKHDHIVQIFCGHLHRNISSQFGGKITTVCPSTSHKVLLHLEEDTRLATTNEPSEIQLHLWDGKGRITTHSAFTAPFDILWELEGPLDY